MAQRHEITAWVNPSAWDDEVEAQRVIEAIIESGSDDEAEWVRIAGGDDADQQAAADRDYDRTDAALSEQVTAYRTAETVMTGAREALHAEMRRLYAAGDTQQVWSLLRRRRDFDRADEALSEQVAAYRTAETVMTGAREALHAEMRRLYTAGMSAYRLARVTGLAERHVGRIVSA